MIHKFCLTLQQILSQQLHLQKFEKNERNFSLLSTWMMDRNWEKVAGIFLLIFKKRWLEEWMIDNKKGGFNLHHWI